MDRNNIKNYIEELLNKDDVSDDEIEKSIIMLIATSDNDDDLEFFSGLPPKFSEWDTDLVDAYAEHVHNYLYQYKPEAKEVDSSIDTEEMHVGTMAQDIEQVAPDCVNENEDGVKVVDGERLALVNAGVIGDICRRLKALEEKLGVDNGK